MWKTLKTLVETIAELTSEDRLIPQAMPQTHYLNSQQDFADELTLLMPSAPSIPERQRSTSVDHPVRVIGQPLQM